VILVFIAFMILTHEAGHFYAAKKLDEIRDTGTASRRQARLVIEAMEKKS